MGKVTSVAGKSYQKTKEIVKKHLINIERVVSDYYYYYVFTSINFFSLVERSKSAENGLSSSLGPMAFCFVLFYALSSQDLPFYYFLSQYMPSPLTSTPHVEILESYFFSLFSLFFALCT